MLLVNTYCITILYLPPGTYVHCALHLRTGALFVGAAPFRRVLCVLLHLESQPRVLLLGLAISFRISVEWILFLQTDGQSVPARELACARIDFQAQWWLSRFLSLGTLQDDLW